MLLTVSLINSMNFKKITESVSNYDRLENMTIVELTKNINKEDKSVANAVNKELTYINKLITKVIFQLRSGGRLFYIGSGTSGRLGIVDASECPPTFGVSHKLVIGIIAGGDKAIRKSVEKAEDNMQQGWFDLKKFDITNKDFVVGISASGTTPYVLGALTNCIKNKIPTGCITCNPNSPVALNCDFPIQIIVGPEFITGSSRMKAGTAQKMVLNMITTTTMIGLGKILGNKMVDMQLSNEKLINRGTNMIVEQLGLEKAKALKLLKKYKSVREAINQYRNES